MTGALVELLAPTVQALGEPLASTLAPLEPALETVALRPIATAVDGLAAALDAGPPPAASGAPLAAPPADPPAAPAASTVRAGALPARAVVRRPAHRPRAAPPARRARAARPTGRLERPAAAAPRRSRGSRGPPPSAARHDGHRARSRSARAGAGAAPHARQRHRGARRDGAPPLPSPGPPVAPRGAPGISGASSGDAPAPGGLTALPAAGPSAQPPAR